MAKALVITEKPSVARDIAAALGGFEDHDGYFESDDHVLTFAVGHLFELLEPEEVDEAYKRWTLDTLPIIPDEFKIKPKSGHSERIRTIKKLLQRDDVDRLINACDAGREGELIFREIVKHFGSDKPIQRLWLQSMTRDAIRDGFQRLRPGEELEGLAAAAECRAFSDWLIGMNATRALTKRLKSRREKTAWSAGRVQTPTLAILVGREFEVLAHVPRPYWRVEGTFEHAGQAYTGAWFDPDFKAGDDDERKDDRIFEEARANAIVAAATGQTGQARETRKPSKESAPPLFDLTSLQREANRRLGWSARRTLSAAQRCYEGHKLLTYPRTDSRCLPNDYRDTVHGVLQAFSAAADAPGVADYAPSAARLLSDGLENEGRIFNDAGVSDHFAIIPTGNLPPAELSGDDKRLFDLVTRRFLGAFHPPAEWERVERVTEVAGEHFRTRARSLQKPGWRAVLGESEEESVSLPALAPGQSEASGVPVPASEITASAEETKPPPRVTEARLLSLMENAGKQVDDEDIAAVLHEKGIGTPATRADIIENLIAKGYVVRAGKSLRPTVKGIRLIDTLRRIQIDRLASPELTGELEQHLMEVEHGQRTAAKFMQEVSDYAAAVVERAKTFEYEELYDHEPPLGPCPVGGSKQVVERAWFYTCEKANGLPIDEKADPNCPHEKCPLLIWKDTSGRYIDRRTAAALIKDGQTGVVDGFTARNGRVYKGVMEFDKDEGWAVKVRSMGTSEDAVSADPEYEVDPEPLGPCPFDCDLNIVETSTQFLCESKLKAEAEAEKAALAEGKDQEAAAKKARKAKGCGFVMPRTVCKREITRDEALVYLKNGRTDLLTDFTSRFGRPFSATLVLKDTGRHGFEFPPRAPRKKAGDGDAEPGKKKAPAKKAGRKTTRKKKAAAKKTGSKKTAAKKAGAKKTSAKKTSTKKAGAKKAGTRKTASRKKSPAQGDAD